MGIPSQEERLHVLLVLDLHADVVLILDLITFGMILEVKD